MGVDKLVPVTKEEGFSFEVWKGLLKTILMEDFCIEPSDEQFTLLLENYYDANYTIKEAVDSIFNGN